MKKLVVIAAAAVSALVAAAPSAAKEMTLLQVCGTNGCKAIKSAGPMGHDGGMRSAARPEPQSYYLLNVGIGDGKRILGRETMYFVAGPGAVTWRTDDPQQTWMAFRPTATAAMRAAAKGLKPFGAPQLESVYIGERRSVDPAPYAELIGPLDSDYAPSSEYPITVTLNWQHPNPWAKDGAQLGYLVKAKLLLRSDGYFRVPDRLAVRLAREHRGLAPVVPGDGFPWGVLLGTLGGAIVLAGGALVAYARRRRPRSAEHPVPA